MADPHPKEACLERSPSELKSQEVKAKLLSLLAKDNARTFDQCLT